MCLHKLSGAGRHSQLLLARSVKHGFFPTLQTMHLLPDCAALPFPCASEEMMRMTQAKAPPTAATRTSKIPVTIPTRANTTKVATNLRWPTSSSLSLDALESSSSFKCGSSPPKSRRDLGSRRRSATARPRETAMTARSSKTVPSEASSEALTTTSSSLAAVGETSPLQWLGDNCRSSSVSVQGSSSDSPSQSTLPLKLTAQVSRWTCSMISSVDAVSSS
mmetsp:Transcript_27724/g.41961  ORF Transcript_27724/g.41961 Transcript_27724/m.41961 type:complete len:220 (+) Transcript_27724:367-1026(+)